ncbi:MAG: hypothetical protein OEV44_14880, partial [Spirochaetota bacterium]|nr:hypothetical protein [Spirochaetota bacterium]
MESKLMLQNIEKPSQRLIIKVLLFSTFVISICGLTYELLIGSLSTNLEGNPILQYSLTIGFFMSALGLGSYLSRFFIHRLLYQFIIIEIVLGVIGGISIAVLNLVYINLNSIYPIANILVLVIIGILVGLEIPIITRILKDFGNLKETISNVLTIDYIGGLAASLIFPLVLYPFLGLIKTAFIVGFINVIIGIINLIIFSDEIKKEKIAIWLASILSLMVLGSGIIFSNLLTGYYSYQLYAALNPTQLYGTVLYNEQSRYQKIVLTRYLGETQLLLNGHLQFSSFDEYRYHEALIFPPFMLKDDLKTILIMGGGDGLGVKQILKFSPYHNLNVILVDLDPQMTQLAKTFPIMKEINDNAFNNPSVTIINQDAYKYLGSTNLKFDVIYADFPDPHDATLSKLYSMEFFHFVKRRLNKNG